MDAELEEEAPKQPAGAPAWMATMADMMSLLLTFFVLLLSFANMDVIKFRTMLGSVKDAFGVQKEHVGDIEARATTPIQLSNTESTPFLVPPDRPSESSPGSAGGASEMVKEAEEAIAQLGLGRTVEVESTVRGVVIRVTGQLLFDSGSARLRPEALIFLDEIARLARAFPYEVSIEGHTDDIPIRTEEFPTNWHLSADRAIAALQYLAEVGRIDRSRLSAAGFADTRPLVANDSSRKRATNRRVEFVYLRGSSQAKPPPVPMTP